MIENKSLSLILLSLAILISSVSYCQSITPQSINSSGIKMSQTNGSISFTVGELVILTQVDSEGNSIGNSFTSGATISTVSIKEPNKEILSVKVFPNPTTELVNIQINNSSIDQVIISIINIQGKEVYNGIYSAISNTIGINMANYNTGNYFLAIQNKNNEVLGTYKIIKD